MMKRNIWILCFLLLSCALAFAGCAFRTEEAVRSVPADFVPSETDAEETYTPGAITYSVRFFVGETELASEQAEAGALCPFPGNEQDGCRIIRWTDRDGNLIDPAVYTVTDDAELYAETRPILPGNVKLLDVDQNGLVSPGAPLTREDLRFSVTGLLGDKADALLTDCAVSEDEGAADSPEIHSVLNALFDPVEVEPLWDSLVAEDVSMPRDVWIDLMNELLPDGNPDESFYSPDVSPDRADYEALARFCTASELTAEALAEQAEDGYLWFDGYLYRLGEDGYFLSDVERNGLLFASDCRYTSTNEELDAYVAETIRQYCKADLTRRENLKLIYDHVKNDFQYLTRNYYDSGETGWDIQEALTLFSTGKGNCYCYAGVFCYLARGLGYNARTYSGSMGVENQPHAWTEITEEDGIYICDPEIEMNYWYLEMYTDNFMMKKETAGGWNYQSVGRTGE